MQKIEDVLFIGKNVLFELNAVDVVRILKEQPAFQREIADEIAGISGDPVAYGELRELLEEKHVDDMPWIYYPDATFKVFQKYGREGEVINETPFLEVKLDDGEKIGISNLDILRAAPLCVIETDGIEVYGLAFSPEAFLLWINGQKSQMPSSWVWELGNKSFTWASKEHAIERAIYAQEIDAFLGHCYEYGFASYYNDRLVAIWRSETGSWKNREVDFHCEEYDHDGTNALRSTKIFYEIADLDGEDAGEPIPGDSICWRSQLGKCYVALRRGENYRFAIPVTRERDEIRLGKA